MDWLSTLPHCAIYGKPVLAGLLVFGNIGIWMAYMAVPVAIEIVRRKRGIPYNGLAVLFAAFIVLCGLGHLCDAFAMVGGSAWAYWFEGIIAMATAAVSLITAYYAYRLIPELANFPTAHDWYLMKRRVKIYEDRTRAQLGLEKQ